VIDQVYDFAGTVLDVQRNFAKQLVTASASVAEDVAQRATAAANEAGATVANATGRDKKQSAGAGGGGRAAASLAEDVARRATAAANEAGATVANATGRAKKQSA